MNNTFEYRQRCRQNRLEERRRLAFKRRVCKLAAIVTFVILFVMVISANAVIANAGQGYEKEYQKTYTNVIVEKGETVWNIALQQELPGNVDIKEYIDEICFINELDESSTIYSDSLLTIPRYIEF